MKSEAYILKGKSYTVDLDDDRLIIETLGSNFPAEVCVLSGALVPEEIVHFIAKLRHERNVGNEIKAGRIPQMQCSSCGSPLVNNTHCLICRNRIENLGDKIIAASKVFSGETPLPVSESVPEAFAKQFSVQQAERNKAANEAAEFTGNKYHRKIIGLDGIVTVTDVYRVLDAFDVREPGLQHAIKKLLCAGIRGKNDTDNDLKEAIDAITATRLTIKQKKDLF